MTQNHRTDVTLKAMPQNNQDENMITRVSSVIGIVGSIFLIGPAAAAYTNEWLMKERLISPAVYELLNRHNATTREQRQEVIQSACNERKLPAIDCKPMGSPRSRYRY